MNVKMHTLDELAKLVGKTKRQVINRRNALGIKGTRVFTGNRHHLEFSQEEAEKIVEYMRPRKKAVSDNG
jgi:hypothetical protein